MNSKPKKPAKKENSTWNPWLIVTIVLALILAAVIFYDLSPTFQKNVNYIFGIQAEEVETEPQVNITVLTDKFYENPPYDLEEQVESLKDEIEAEINTVVLDVNDEEGKKLIEDFSLVAVPVIIFDENVKDTDFYEKATGFFTEVDGNYLLRLQPFSYLTFPDTSLGQVKGVTGDDAPITIIEYSSFSCPYCALMKEGIYQALDEYPGKIKFIFKHFNRGGMDSLLTNAAECAGEQGKFWEMHDYLFANFQDIKDDAQNLIIQNSTTLGIDKTSFETCINENKYNNKVQEQTEEGLMFGVSGTPALFVNDTFIAGAVQYEELKLVIDSYNP